MLATLFALSQAGLLRAQEAPRTKNRVPHIAHAIRVERPPRLDGMLNDPAWQAAEPIANFLQREPYEGQQPTEKTTVRILYTRRAVYFGIECFDSEPKKIVATELRRDVSQDLDDYFEIAIDSTHSLRNAYVFQINPLGTQRDGVITDEHRVQGGDFDPGWDGVWESEARVTAVGWTATVEIPFTTLNFMTSQDVVWGINFKRFIRRKNEEDLWAGWPRIFGIVKISQAGELRGITGIESGRLFIVKPYALGGVSHLPQTAAPGGLTPDTKALYTGGLDIKLGLQSNLVANLTGNTDFADADVDTQQFNLTPYRLFFPEKRQFFLENSGVFDFPLGGGGDQFFFSRNIGINPVNGQEEPISGGAKVTGSLAGFDAGVMDVHTRSAGPNPAVNYAVVRLKRSLFGKSYIGVIGIDKRSGDTSDPFNEGGGADARIVLARNLVVRAYATETRTKGLSNGQTNIGAAMNYFTNWMDFYGGRRKIGPNFNPEVGFIELSDCVCDYLDLNLKARPRIRGIRQLSLEGFLDHKLFTHGALRTQEWQPTFRVEFNNGSYTDDDIVDVFAQRLTTPFNIYKNVNIPVGVYRWTRHQLSYGSPEDRRWTVRIRERWGGYYDGHLNEATVRATYRVNEHISYSFSEQWNRFRLREGNFSVLVGSLLASYSFSRFLSLSALVQMDTANTQGASTNLRLRWNYRPDSDLYIIYTAGQRFSSLVAANPSQFTEHRFAVKYSYSFTP